MDDVSAMTGFNLTDGAVNLFSDKLKKLTVTIDLKQQREYGGTSKYSFHLTEQDSESSVNIENAVFDFNQLAAATGSTSSVGAVIRPKQEKLTVASSAVTLSKAASLVADSQKVIVWSKSHANAGKVLSKVASAPGATEYTIASGVITFGDATLEGLDVRVFYNYTTAATGETLSIKNTTKNSPMKIVLEGSFLDDELNVRKNMTFIIYKAQLLGSFVIDQTRKSATSNSLDLAILDPDRADGKVIDIIID
jgi:hypothetical protein